MKLCLYHPRYGYYMQGIDRTGVGGDYFTSSDLHPVFARLMLRQAAEIWNVLEDPRPFVWTEMGAGRGLFAHDFLQWARHTRPEFYEVLKYIVIEPAPLARARLRERFAGTDFEGRVESEAALEQLEPVTGCFFSNELADAFPVAVVTRHQGRLKEIYVDADHGALVEKLGPLSDAAVAGAVARYANELEEGQRVEISRTALQWTRSVAEKLERGFVITVDYGDLAPQLYTLERPRGTLMAYRRHMVCDDLFAAPGEQDLTAHVNFSALIDAGRQSGLEYTGFTTQERFLMALGEANEFQDLYEPNASEGDALQARLKLKRLLDPRYMGTIFKVLIQHRGILTPRLTGLKFQRG